MKIIAVDRLPGSWPAGLDEALRTHEAPHPSVLHADLLTDSAVVRRGTPMFVPDFARQWRLEVVPAVIIDRLGKWIEPRFASRYYHTVTACVRLMPPANAPLHGAFAVNFDGAIAPGLPLEFASEAPLVIRAGSSAELTFSPEELHVNDLVALVSRFMTLKTGDIILPCSAGITLPVELDTKVRVTLDDTEVLNLKIK